MAGVIDPSLVIFDEPPQEVLDALLAGVLRVRRRVEIYEADGITEFDIPNWDKRLIEGSVTVDRERDERRMCDFLLDNNDGALVNDPYDGFWFDKILKAFWGIVYYDVNGTLKSWEIQVGEFMIDRIDEDYFPNSVKVTGRDYAKKCLVSKLQTSLSFPLGTKIENIVMGLAANAGVSKFALPITGQAYMKDIVFARGTERWKVMQQVADTIGHEVFFTPNGYLTMRSYPDPTYSPIAWNFKPGGPDGSLVKYSRSSNDTNVFNHIIVSGATDTASGVNTTVFADKRNDDNTSPTRISRIGDRVKVIQSDYITSQDQAEQLAQQLLNINALEEYSINFEAVLLPWLEVGSIVQIVDDSASDFTPKRFLLSSYNIPFGLGPMSGVARRVTIVGSRHITEFI